jgi:hypothetical protein
MPTISVRITDEERKRLVKYGPLSETVRRALEMYLKENKKREVIEEIRRYQKEHPVHVDPDEIVRIIREGRSH